MTGTLVSRCVDVFVLVIDFHFLEVSFFILPHLPFFLRFEKAVSISVLRKIDIHTSKSSVGDGK